MSTLRNRLARLAAENPDVRAAIRPTLSRQGSDEPLKTKMNLIQIWSDKASGIQDSVESILRGAKNKAEVGLLKDLNSSLSKIDTTLDKLSDLVKKPNLDRTAKSEVKTVATAAQLQKWADKVGDLMSEVHSVHTKANDPKEVKLLSAITTALNTIDTTIDKINDL